MLFDFEVIGCIKAIPTLRFGLLQTCVDNMLVTIICFLTFSGNIYPKNY